mmetsp:Transcript_6615/g.10019  ORF Transcript_6615/g.10019 Transcript_6615/m.10019 type:complete len:136 (-) Transcript_6615:80-487(-)
MSLCGIGGDVDKVCVSSVLVIIRLNIKIIFMILNFFFSFFFCRCFLFLSAVDPRKDLRNVFGVLFFWLCTPEQQEQLGRHGVIKLGEQTVSIFVLKFLFLPSPSPLLPQGLVRCLPFPTQVVQMGFLPKKGLTIT